MNIPGLDKKSKWAGKKLKWKKGYNPKDFSYENKIDFY